MILNSFTTDDYNIGSQWPNRRRLFSSCREISSKGLVNSFCIKNHSVKKGRLNLVLSLFHPRGPRGSQSGREKRRDESFQVRGERAPGYRLSPNYYFQNFKRMLAPDWAQKMLCIIVPNRGTVSPEFFSWVRTRRLLSRSRLVWIMHQRNERRQETFSLI